MKKLKQLAVMLLSAMMLFSSVACDFDWRSLIPGNGSGSNCQHKAIYHKGVEATCESSGKLAYWECVGCGAYFSDKDCKKEISKVSINVEKKAHDLEKHERVEATESSAGNIEYYTCGDCGKYFSDAQGKNEITANDITLSSPITALDFVIDVPADRDPIVLQLADPQLIDSSTMRSANRLGTAAASAWGPDTREVNCYKYIRETINETNPDLILITGDVIYGEFDDDGHLLEEFVQFMEGFDTPWAPVMGNHDNESLKGADWICEQYENAPNCMFKRGDISGNGNYTIGIRQGGELKRVFLNMDTNGCTGAPQSDKDANKTIHQYNNSWNYSVGAYGLQKDQVEWFQETVDSIKAQVPDIKISFHFHIAMMYFAEAYNNAYKSKVGDPVAQYQNTSGAYYNGSSGKVLYPERVAGHGESDFGTLIWLCQAQTPDFWDSAKTYTNSGDAPHTIYNKMKAVGTDSIFVGHYHSNSVSIVYDGIRFQYGQKSSTFDNTQCINESTGAITGPTYLWNNPPAGLTPLVGGTVIPLDKETGEIVNPYIYYCSGAGKEVNWAKWKK